MTLALGCLAAWVLGGIPFGLVLVRLFLGVDIRTIGSGNVGATNASRAFSKRVRLPVFFLIYLLDFAKGFLPAFFGPALLGLTGAGELTAAVLLGASAVVGHCASPFLKLRGGKGVATTTGLFAAVELYPLLLALGVFGLVLGVTRQVYLGSLALGLALAGAVILRDPATAFDARLPVSIAALVAALFLFWTHRSNIRKALARRRETAHASSS